MNIKEYTNFFLHNLRKRNSSFIAVLHFTATIWSLIMNIMVSVLASSVADRGFDPDRVKPKDY
jgi:hypothetical protein